MADRITSSQEIDDEDTMILIRLAKSWEECLHLQMLMDDSKWAIAYHGALQN